MFNLIGAEIYFFHNLAKCCSLLLLVLFFNDHFTKKKGPFLAGYCKLLYTEGRRFTKMCYVKLILNLNVKIYAITPWGRVKQMSEWEEEILHVYRGT